MTDTEQLLARVADKARKTPPRHGTSLPAPVTADALARAEAELGFALPPLLAALYTRMADGGYGPEYGLFPLRTAVARYTARRATDPDATDWPWPEGVLPILDWGCAMNACVDCRSDDATVLLFEPNPGIPDLAWYVDAPSLGAWITAWTDGTAWYDRLEEDLDADFDDLGITPWPHFRDRARS
ncbi:SMI1/KNR4 family protein [Streptomyces sp. NPDC059909]|uniref:SMI1/KNR4 family protein n=1 Tax=Streptomyces sp. NPDC059909 TaxID=3346998 RepID=UPI0036463F3D